MDSIKVQNIFENNSTNNKMDVTFREKKKKRRVKVYIKPFQKI